MWYVLDWSLYPYVAHFFKAGDVQPLCDTRLGGDKGNPMPAGSIGQCATCTHKEARLPKENMVLLVTPEKARQGYSFGDEFPIEYGKSLTSGLWDVLN